MARMNQQPRTPAEPVTESNASCAAAACVDGASKYATIRTECVESKAGTHDWYYAVICPEGAAAAGGGPFKSRAGALAEAIARASTLRLPVAPEALALLTVVDEPAGYGLTYQVSGFGTIPDAPALRRPAANEQAAASRHRKASS